MPTNDAPLCECGHAKTWHATLHGCHCGCKEYRPAPPAPVDEVNDGTYMVPHFTVMHDKAVMDEIRTLQAECQRLKADVDNMRAALNAIASWNEGPEVTTAFDDPRSAAIARAALKAKGAT